MANVKISEDKKLKFYPKKHSYVLKKKKLIGATTLLKEYFSEFDASKMAKLKVFIAKAKAKKEGREVGEEGKVSYWKKKWKESAEHGTRTHGLLEEFVLLEPDKSFIVDASKYEQRDLNKCNQARHWLIRYFDANKDATKKPEMLIYDEELGVAGQIDLPVFKKNGKKKTVSLIDFKTNDKITTTGYKGAKAKAPLEELPDCSLSKYTLQLSLYAYMLERQGYAIEELILLHLQEDRCEEMKIPYRRDLIEKLIAHRKQSVAVV